MLRDMPNVPKRFVILAALVVIVLVAGVKMQSMFMLFVDQLFSSAVQSEFMMFLEPVMRLITMIADTKLGLIYAVLIAAYLWLRQGQRVDAIWVICTMFGGAVVAYLLKEFVKRPRPTIAQIVPETGYSMPSGHTFEAFLVLAFLYLFFVRPMAESSLKKACTAGLVIWQILVIWSRIFMGAHYLTDTLVAVGLGTVWLWVAIMLYQSLYDTIASYIEPSVGRHHQR
ncbi:phosphatase PAP2 family protein [Pediococcus acidilactici]|uniref:Phosphatase PAP2 family protein n=1 Tax=Pediococcus acidilactici TaxID=1254 RepID=A0AAW8YHN0_PEDAC|nr:phosphatase PAP2 family protein [Pediococcus acidilactici]GAC45895.1 membrane-associated phospholipid phosphatase [Pediococcus acidilactici NGRI 0510Q]KRN91004.1 membrane-associated phospholipid phosphatase [Pediococcus acidilactici]MDD9323754.1 phosphatase PAP2 family protein [Pediococcus acidilactici]MDV2621652.1 phosphatase PAP2 family protein [Pediococcus acidilactici]NBI15177.1 phosphatase PAP2 family protein [Pediococcus acidilactici]